MTDDIIHFNPWRDFNDAPAVADDDPFDLEPDPAQIDVFLDVVFGYCEGWIPFRGFIDPVERDPVGDSPSSVIVTDYKTGKPPVAGEA